MQLQEIRENEKRSHTEIYTNCDLYSEGSWLRKPVKTVLDLLPLFQDYEQLHALDLGCGVGRNSIAIAKYFSPIPCYVGCVDILDFAIGKLLENAEKFHVSNSIQGIVSPIEEYAITPSSFDLILAISALEHMDSKESLIAKLTEIREGTRDSGVVCLIMNSAVREYDKATGCEIPAQFEVNLPTEELQNILCSIFSGWEILKLSRQPQQYEIPRKDGIAALHTTVITFVARK